MEHQHLKTEQLTLPPHSVEAEQSVLGGLMLAAEAWDYIVERVTAGDFYRPSHRIIFESIEHLATNGQPLDHLTIAEFLDNIAKLEQVGGLPYLVELSRNTPSVANIGAYADIVRERSFMRQMIFVARQIEQRAYNPAGLSSAILLERAEREVFNIARNRTGTQGPQAVANILAATVDRIDQLFNSGQALTGIASGFKDLDKITCGFQNTDFIVVAGRPSMGKTTLAVNMVENALHDSDDRLALLFSLEMPAEQIMMRMLASLGRIDQTKVRTGRLSEEDWPKIATGVKMLQNKKLFIDDTAAISPAEIRARARRLVREQGPLSLIMIDYLQLMQIPGYKEGRTNEISEISRSLKALAKEFKCPVIALSQLNRSLEQRPNKRPVNSDLRESGAIEQDADLIMFVYRDEVYNPDTELKGVGEIIIGKHRNGPIGTVRVAFRGQYCRFENLASDSYRQFAEMS